MIRRYPRDPAFGRVRLFEPGTAATVERRNPIGGMILDITTPDPDGGVSIREWEPGTVISCRGPVRRVPGDPLAAMGATHWVVLAITERDVTLYSPSPRQWSYTTHARVSGRWKQVKIRDVITVP